MCGAPATSLSLVPLSSFAGAATSKSNFGTLPKDFESPSKYCPHNLGGLVLRGVPKMDKTTGTIIGVKILVVNCPQCKGAPYLKGKKRGQVQTKTRTITISDATRVAAARALFLEKGPSLFMSDADTSAAADGDEDQDHS